MINLKFVSIDGEIIARSYLYWRRCPPFCLLLPRTKYIYSYFKNFFYYFSKYKTKKELADSFVFACFQLFSSFCDLEANILAACSDFQ